MGMRSGDSMAASPGDLYLLASSGRSANHTLSSSAWRKTSWRRPLGSYLNGRGRPEQGRPRVLRHRRVCGQNYCPRKDQPGREQLPPNDRRGRPWGRGCLQPHLHRNLGLSPAWGSSGPLPPARAAPREASFWGRQRQLSAELLPPHSGSATERGPSSDRPPPPQPCSNSSFKPGLVKVSQPPGAIHDTHLAQTFLSVLTTTPGKQVFL